MLLATLEHGRANIRSRADSGDFSLKSRIRFVQLATLKSNDAAERSALPVVDSMAGSGLFRRRTSSNTSADHGGHILKIPWSGAVKSCSGRTEKARIRG